jgi:hypothetical protein
MTAAFLDLCTAAAQPAISAKVTRDMVRLFGLDRLPVGGARLVCRWHRGADGKLICFWEQEPDSGCLPQADAN